MKIIFINCSNVDIKIIDINNELVYKENNINYYTNVNLEDGIYLLKVYKNGINIGNISFIKNNNCSNIIYYFPYNKKLFILTDYYYPNLLIKRGEINLWHTI